MADDTTRLAVLIEANTRSYERAMARLEQRTNQTMRRSSAAVSTLDARIKGLAAGAGRALATLGIGAGIVGFTALASSIGDVVKEADKLAKTAAKVGLTTDELQELRFAGELTGVAISQTDVAMQRFSRRIAEAAAGGGVLAPVLEANNIQLRDQEGRLRSSRELLGDYAELVKNAGSEQDQLRLSFLAFDTEGAAWVNTMRKGRQGLSDFADEAHRVGAVLDEELIQKAAEVNDDWTRFTTKLTTTWRTFVLNVVSGVSEVIDALDRLPDRDVRERLAAQAIGGNFAKQIYAKQQAQANSPGGAYTPGVYNARTLEAAVLRMGLASQSPGGETIIPPAGGGGGGSGRSAEDKIEKVIDALRHQEAQLGRTAREQAIYNALERAGIDENHAMADTVMALAGELYDHEQALQANIAAMDAFRDAAGEALSSFVSDLRRGMSVADAFGNVLDRLVDRIVETQINNLINNALGLAGTTGSGFFANAAGFLFGGARAAGGPVGAGRGYLVGERGPELFVPKTGGTIVPNGGGGGSILQVIDQRSASAPPIETHRSRGPDGIEMIRAVVRDEIASPRSTRYLRQQFGLKTATVQRG